MTSSNVLIRDHLRPGDVENIIRLHATLYAREYGFNEAFAGYVAEHLREFARSATKRDRIWLAESDGLLVGCIAIVGNSVAEAQLRWFLVSPAERGQGLGKRLLRDAISFCREQGYESIILWTVSALSTAAHLYMSEGFQKVEQQPCTNWGTEVIEEKYVLNLQAT